MTGAKSLEAADLDAVATAFADAVAVAFFSISDKPTSGAAAEQFAIRIVNRALHRHASMIAAAEAWTSLQELGRRASRKGRCRTASGPADPTGR